MNAIAHLEITADRSLGQEIKKSQPGILVLTFLFTQGTFTTEHHITLVIRRFFLEILPKSSQH
jgi:hypothetical protein